MKVLRLDDEGVLVAVAEIEDPVILETGDGSQVHVCEGVKPVIASISTREHVFTIRAVAQNKIELVRDD